MSRKGKENILRVSTNKKSVSLGGRLTLYLKPLK